MTPRKHTPLQNNNIPATLLSSFTIAEYYTQKIKELRWAFQTQTPFHDERRREGERREHLNIGAGKGARAVWDRMSLSISCVMKNDWEGLHGPTPSEDGAIAMHRLLHFRRSKLRPTAREVRLQKDERNARLNVSPLALYPLNDMAHSYKQLAFKDTSRSSEGVKADLDGSLMKTINKKWRKKLAVGKWHLIKD